MKICIFVVDTDKYLKKKKEVVKISGKIYNPHNVEAETFTLFTGVTNPFIQSTSKIELRVQYKFSLKVIRFNKQYLKKAGRHHPKCVFDNHLGNIDR